MSEIHKIDEVYSIKVVRNFNDLYELKGTWDTLAKMQKSYQPWLMLDWFNLFIEHFSNGSQLTILLLYMKTQLVTIAPFVLKRENYKGIVTINKIELLGNHYSPICNFILSELDDHLRRKWLAHILSFFSTKYRHWSIIDIDSIPNEDSCFDILKDSVGKAGFNYREYFCFSNVYIDGITYSGEQYIKNRSRNTRQQVAKKQRRLEKMGGLTFEIGTFYDKFDYYMDQYYSIRRNSWKAPEADVAFHKAFWRMAAKKRWLRCAFLFHKGSAIASLLCLVYEHTAYLLETNYDLTFSKLSPGHILHAELAKYLINVDNVTEMDTMRGAETYKKSWFPQERDRRGLTIFNKDAKGMFLSFLTTSIMPLFERNQHLMSAKDVLSRCLKAKSQH